MLLGSRAAALRAPVRRLAQARRGMMTSTTETIPGASIQRHLGVVMGNTVRTKNVGQDIFAGFKQITGGEIVGK